MKEKILVTNYYPMNGEVFASEYGVVNWERWLELEQQRLSEAGIKTQLCTDKRQRTALERIYERNDNKA